MLPKTLKIIGKTWLIKEAASEFPDQGQCNRDKLTITVATYFPDENVMDTLLHEVIHAIDYSMATRMTEEQVAALATGLFAVFRDNPGLMELFNGRSSVTSGDFESVKRSTRKTRRSRKGNGGS